LGFFSVSTYTDLSSISDMPVNATFVNEAYQDVYFVNGLFQPKMTMAVGENVVLDLINASGKASFPFIH
jgi:hypothetical protein